VPYLAELGISDLYVSPILQAAVGSLHGYDVVDHSRVNPELGDLSGLTDALVAHDLNLTIDVVPNHMAIDGRANRWWWDVMENGPSSRFSRYFDIDWEGEPERTGHRVLVPILGERYGRTLERGELKVVRNGGSFDVEYHDHEMPVSPRTYDAILDAAGLPELAEEFRALPPATATEPVAGLERHDRKEWLKEKLRILGQSDAEAAVAIDLALRKLNSDPAQLDALLRRQNYRLVYWRVGREELDYRRFFNIDSLVGLRVEDDEVFAAVHETTARLVDAGTVDGLRIDHVDGLLDPEGYLHRVRRMAPGAYVVVEKILVGEEALPPSWPVQGTTGYDFIYRVNNLLVAPEGQDDLTGCYSRLTGEPTDYFQVEWEAKHQIMRDDLAPELARLTRLLLAVCDEHWSQRDRTRSELRVALAELIASFPTYRTYVHPDRAVTEPDRERISAAVAAAQQRQREVDADLFDFIGDVLLLRWTGPAETSFALAFPQVSSPVMAKGAEDTAFYRFLRLVSLNEVGGNPATVGRPIGEFYEWCAGIEEHWPHTMLALDTHDTKRSADVRARINLLSEMPDAWEAEATSWLELTDHHAGRDGPDLNMRYLFLQTLVGAWPIENGRLIPYMEKAAREAKVHTSWADPNPAYEDALRAFVEHSLDDPRFRQMVETFLRERRFTELGQVSSLAQTALQLTCPGVPDIYQGAEEWNNRLVDPDNRQPVDFAAIRHQPGPKTRLIQAVLHHRRAHADAYSGFEALSEQVIAFARSGVAVVVPRHTARSDSWLKARVSLPHGTWRSLLTGADHAGTVAAAELLGPHSVAVLVRS
jgi:(1->4)-alpha-D-glucan 1-alpha-D-glucosylmutase